MCSLLALLGIVRTTSAEALDASRTDVVVGLLQGDWPPNVVPASEGSCLEATRVWVDALNGAGGVDGARVVVRAAPEIVDVESARAAAAYVREQGAVVVLAGCASASAFAWLPSLAGSGVPVITGGPCFPHLAVGVGVACVSTPSYPEHATNLMRAVARGGGTSVGVVVPDELTVGSSDAPARDVVVGQALRFDGVQVVVAGPNRGAVCRHFADLGTTHLWSFLLEGLDELQRECAAVGYEPIWARIDDLGPATERAMRDAGVRAVAAFGVFPSFARVGTSAVSTRALAEFRRAYRERAPDLLRDAREHVVTGTWLEGVAFRRAVELSGATGPVTAADVARGVQRFDRETLRGLAATPLSFAPGASPPAETCSFVVTFEGRAGPRKLARVCSPTPTP